MRIAFCSCWLPSPAWSSWIRIRWHCWTVPCSTSRVARRRGRVRARARPLAQRRVPRRRRRSAWRGGVAQAREPAAVAWVCAYALLPLAAEAPQWIAACDHARDHADIGLVARSRSGDRAALAELAAQHGERVRRFLSTMTGDDIVAEDLRQETLLRAMQHIDQLHDDARFSPWLLAIAVNVCRRHLRDEVQRRARGGHLSEVVGDAADLPCGRHVARRGSSDLGRQ